MRGDERARVPFALVGVLVLVSSTTLAATVVTNDPSSTPTVDRAMEGAESETVTALRTAADDAATRTAANPVTVPANTTAGRAIDEQRPFRDALRLRLYLLARERLESVRVRRGGVIANASLPAVEPTTEGYREAIERIRVERAGENGTALRVEVRGVRLTGIHQGRRVATEELSPTFVVANPALLLHDRTERFQQRANAPVTRPGVGRRLTTRLYPITWARGNAQYARAPIANVIGTRHVELATNDALLAEQRAVFGTTDPAADRGIAVAGSRVAAKDAIVGLGVKKRWTDTVLSGGDPLSPAPPVAEPVADWRDPPSDTSVTVGVNGSADRAYARSVGIEGEDGIARAIERAHTVQARVVTDVSQRGVTRRTSGRAGESWALVDERTDRRVTLRRVAARPPRADGWETREGASFRARETETTTRTWVRDSERTTTTTVVERTYRVDVAVQARTAPVAGAPSGYLDRALADTTERAVDNAVGAAGGFETVARDVVDGSYATTTANVTAEPTVERETVETDVRRLRERTRNVSTTVPATELSVGRSNPPRQLEANLTARHERLRGEADRTVEERTFVAARGVYLGALEDRLGTRAERHANVNAGIEDEITDHMEPARLDGALAAHRAATRPPDRTHDDPAGTLSLSVETGPSYLPTSPVRRERIDAQGSGTVHPLATRNLNVFTAPHGQVVQAIFDRLPVIGDDTVSLATAAEVLEEMDGTEAEYDPLREEVESANGHVRGELVAAMTAEGVPESEAEAAIETNASTADEARALANGSAVDRAVRRVDAEGVDRDRLRVRLELARKTALTDGAARPSQSGTSEAADALKREFRAELESMAADRLEAGIEDRRKRVLGKRMGSLPAGLPLSPTGTWYVTTNVWYVDVGGTYERFTVRSNRGDARASTAYVREGRVTRLTHAGRSLRIGRDERVSFRTETVVIVVVPPGRDGVGDTDGVADERSPGWPPDEAPPNGT